MIDDIIYNKKNKFGLIWSCILKLMNFLIFRNFSRIFINFSEFILDLFRFLKMKKISFLSC